MPWSIAGAIVCDVGGGARGEGDAAAGRAFIDRRLPVEWAADWAWCREAIVLRGVAFTEGRDPFEPRCRSDFPVTGQRASTGSIVIRQVPIYR